MGTRPHLDVPSRKIDTEIKKGFVKNTLFFLENKMGFLRVILKIRGNSFVRTVVSFQHTCSAC